MGEVAPEPRYGLLGDAERLVRPHKTRRLTFEDLAEPGPTFRETSAIVPIESAREGDEQVLAARDRTDRNKPLIDLGSLARLPSVRSVVASTEIRAERPLPQIEDILMFGMTPVLDQVTAGSLTGLKKLWAGWAPGRRRLATEQLPDSLEALGVCRHNLCEPGDGRARFAELLRFSKLRQLWLNDCWPKDSLAPLGELTDLVRFRCDAPAGWAQLKNCHALEEVRAIGARVANLKPFRTWSKLRKLAVARGLRSLDGIDAFRSLRELRLVMLKTESLEPLAGMPELQNVELVGMQKTRDLQPLGTLPSLRRFSVPVAGIEYRDLVRLETIRPLADAQKLEEIRLDGAIIEDGDLSPLADLPALRRVSVYGDVRVEALRRARPDIEIDWSKGKPPPGELIGQVYLRPPLKGSSRWWIREDLTEALGVSTNAAAEAKLRTELKRVDPELLGRLDFDTEADAVTINGSTEQDMRAVGCLIGGLARK